MHVHVRVGTSNLFDGLWMCSLLYGRQPYLSTVCKFCRRFLAFMAHTSVLHTACMQRWIGFFQQRVRSIIDEGQDSLHDASTI